MQPDVSAQIKSLEQKVDAVYASAEKTRKYLLWTLILSVVFFILPLIGIAFALPSFMSDYVGALGSGQ